MADDVAPAKSAPDKPAKAGGMSAMLGPVAAVVVLLAVGVGIGVYVAGLVSGVKKAEVKTEVVKEKDSGPLLEARHEIALPDLISNVRGEQGHRYIKVSCSIWLNKADATKMGFLGGGEGGKGGAADIKRIMQMSLEEHLKNYDLNELTGPNIYGELKKGFADQIDKALHRLFPSYPPDHNFVEEVVLTNLLVQ